MEDSKNKTRRSKKSHSNSALKNKDAKANQDNDSKKRGKDSTRKDNPQRNKIDSTHTNGKSNVLQNRDLQGIQENPQAQKGKNRKHQYSDVESNNKSPIKSMDSMTNSLSNGQQSSYSASKQSTKTELPNKQTVNFGSDETISKNNKNTNRVRMTRYTMLSWAPLSLLYQFKRASNIYFLIISILTFMPFSPKDPSSMVGTFIMVLFFTMLKEAYEDYQRYKQQKEVNNKKAKVFDYKVKRFEYCNWDKVKVGQLIRIEKDNEVPADTLVLFSSNVSGLVFVDTMALDGETNLKEKLCILESFDEKDVANIHGNIICDTPNEQLENWDSSLSSNLNKEKVQCSIKNLLLRGSFVRNTKFAYGIVIYTGAETKIFKNLKKAPHKVSNVMKMMNYMLYTVFAFQIIIITIFAGLHFQWAQINYGNRPEIGKSASDASFQNAFLLQMLTYWVAYSHMIPISLYVIIEVLKLGQGILINKDIQMWDRESGQFANCRNSDLTEELGMVEMIFSDKTGTLTMNKMIFKRCTINGLKYGEQEFNVPLTQQEDAEGMNKEGINAIRERIKLETKAYYKASKDPKNQLNILDYPHLNFLKIMSLCHTVVCDASGITNVVRYQASSPDELALVSGAKEIGVELVARNHNRLEIDNKIGNVQETYKVMAEFPFDSTRKCMSVIVKDQWQKYFIYTKGADNVMLEKIDFSKSKNANFKDTVKKDLYNYSCAGLRTLVLAMREVSEDEVTKYQNQKIQLMESNHPNKEQKLSELHAKMEQHLQYIGSTAIEDKLQDGVPQTIAMLIKADIRFWMLTGDKLETAIEIAKSCRIIQEKMQLITLSTHDFEELNRILSMQIKQYNLDVTKKVKSLKNFEQANLVIAIDGSTLAIILEDPELEKKFFYVSLVAKSVVCCRVSPKQKADVVGMYKKKGTWVCLSVGDGANDVSMILEANIGIGIRGKEGTQAVRAADYSISQFRFIQKLLLVHGRWGYRRVSKMICYYFYKNIILVFTEIYFPFFNGFSGQIFFLDWLPMLYNAFFTSWQCLFSFMFEQDINMDYSYKYPIVYKGGQMGILFNFTMFWKQIFLAFVHGAVCFFIPIMVISYVIQFFQCAGQLPSSIDGYTEEHWFYSTISFTLIIHLVCFKLFIESSFWNTFSMQAFFKSQNISVSGVVSILIYYIVTLIMSTNSLANIFQPQLNGLMIIILKNPKFWLMLITVPFVCLFPDLTMQLIYNIFKPTPIEKIKFLQKKDPNFSFAQEQIYHEIGQYLLQIIKRNQSLRQPTNKIPSQAHRGNSEHSGNNSIGLSLNKLSKGKQIYESSNPSPLSKFNNNSTDQSSNTRQVEAKVKRDRKGKKTNEKLKSKLNETDRMGLILNDSSVVSGTEGNSISNDPTFQNSSPKKKDKKSGKRDKEMMEKKLDLNKKGVTGTGDSVSKKQKGSKGTAKTIKEELDEESLTIKDNPSKRGKSYKESAHKVKSPNQNKESGPGDYYEEVDTRRDESYKERKKRMMQNIKNSDSHMKEVDKVSPAREFYHPNNQNNQIAKDKLDEFNKDIINKLKLGGKAAIKDGKRPTSHNDLQLGNIFKQQSTSKNSNDLFGESERVPKILKDIEKSQIGAKLIQDEGHPLEKPPFLPIQKQKKKRYVEKYRLNIIKFSDSGQEEDAYQKIENEFQLK